MIWKDAVKIFFALLLGIELVLLAGVLYLVLVYNAHDMGPFGVVVFSSLYAVPAAFGLTLLSLLLAKYGGVSFMRKSFCFPFVLAVLFQSWSYLGLDLDFIIFLGFKLTSSLYYLPYLILSAVEFALIALVFQYVLEKLFKNKGS